MEAVYSIDSMHLRYSQNRLKTGIPRLGMFWYVGSPPWKCIDRWHIFAHAAHLAKVPNSKYLLFSNPRLILLRFFRGFSGQSHTLQSHATGHAQCGAPEFADCAPKATHCNHRAHRGESCMSHSIGHLSVVNRNRQTL